MKNSSKTTKNIKSFISLSLIFTFIYLIMCPFAQALTSGNYSQSLIPQKQVIKNHCKQTVRIASLLHPFTECQVDNWVDDKEVIRLPTTTHQEPAFSLSIITTSRLII